MHVPNFIYSMVKIRYRSRIAECMCLNLYIQWLKLGTEVSLQNTGT